MTTEEKLKKKYGKRYEKLFSSDFRESIKNVEKVRKILNKVDQKTLDKVISELRYGRAEKK
jgi:hypothetical protein